MKVLLVNTWGYLRGGDARCCFEQEAALRALGHEVERFHMVHPENRPARYARTFLPRIDWRRSIPGGAGGALFALARTTWSRDAAQRMDRLLRHFEPDVVHVHHLHHHLTPSILKPPTRRSIPVVWTLHDFELLCPNGLLYTRDAPCERCRGGRYHNAVLHRCKRGTRRASLAAAAEQWLHARLDVLGPVAALIAPSRFLHDRVVAWEAARPRDAGGRLLHLPHAAPAACLEPIRPPPPGGPLLYCGRLTPEKGLLTVIEALAAAPGVQLRVLGDGPQRAELTEAARRHAPGRVRFEGHQPETAVLEALDQAQAAVLASRWYENQPYAVLEAQARGRACFVADHGGLAELVDDEVGRRHQPGDAQQLGRQLHTLWAQPEELARLGQAARRRINARATPRHWAEAMVELYRSIGAGG